MEDVSSLLKINPPIGVEHADDLQEVLVKEKLLAGIIFHHKEVGKYTNGIKYIIHVCLREVAIICYIANHIALLFQTITELPGKLNYTIRFPAESRSAVTFVDTHLYNWFTNLLFPSFLTPGPRNHDVDDGGIPSGYRQEGFLAIQNAIATAFLKSFSIIDIPEIILQV